MTQVIVFLFLILFAVSGFGQTTYFIDATDGSDGNDGLTPADAWQTLANIGTAISGDSVLLQRGEIWQNTATRTLEGGVIYADYGVGNRPIIEGSARVAGWTLDTGSRYFATTTLVDNANFMVWEEGNKGNRETALIDVDIARDFFLDDPANRIYYIASDSADPDTHTMNVDNNSNPFIIEGSSADGVIRNWHVRRSSNTILILNQFSGTPGATATTGWLIEGSRFSEGNLHGTQIFGGGEGSSLTFRDSRFDKNTLSGMALITVQETTIDGVLADTNDGVGINVEAEITSSGIIIKNTVAHSNGSDGIAIAGGVGGDEIIENCQAFANGRLVNDRSGIVTLSDRTTIRYSQSYDNALSFATGHGIQVDVGSSDCEVYGNLLWNNTDSGIAMGNGAGHKAYNNTIHSNGLHGIFLYHPNADNVELKNNIFSSNPTHVRTVTGVTGSDFDFNLYDDDTGTKFNWLGTVYNFADWKTNSLQDANSPTPAIPLFIEAPNDNFTLQGSSPAIDIALDLGTSFDDALLPGSDWPFGVLIVQQGDFGAGWEIGAYVFRLPGMRRRMKRPR